MLDVPAGTVKSRLFHARQRVREYLGEAMPAPFRAQPEGALTLGSRRLAEGDCPP